MIPTKCAICNTTDNFHVLYPARLPKNISAHEYAPRRNRDFYHYQFVECNTCGLVRSHPVLNEEEIKTLYCESLSDYDDKHVPPFQNTYGRYLRAMLVKYSVRKDALLEIGCANGFFFPVAKSAGFKKIAGIEPSRDAIERAAPEYKSFITHGFFTGKEYPRESFDVIVFFQTFDHVLDPNKFLKSCLNILKPGGFILAINHNAKSLTAKIMGERCPIFDIGHAYLYDKNTMRKIFENNGFIVHNVFSVKNLFSFEYILRLLPLSQKLKEKVNALFGIFGIGALQLSWYMGNLGIIAEKR